MLRKIPGKIFANFPSNQIDVFSPYAGDMLELWAVDLPELYHLNDVIVFSTQGDREYLNTKIVDQSIDFQDQILIKLLDQIWMVMDTS